MGIPACGLPFLQMRIGAGEEGLSRGGILTEAPVKVVCRTGNPEARMLGALVVMKIRLLRESVLILHLRHPDTPTPQ